MIRVLVILFVLTWILPSSHAEEVTREKAIALVTERLEKLERYAFIYSISRDDSVLSEMKKLVLSGRDTIQFTTDANLTRKVHDEFYWFNNSRYPRHAPHHALGFSDGKTSYYWLSEGNSTNTSSPPSSTHIQAAPSINLFVDEWMIYPLPYFLNNLEVFNGGQELSFTATVEHDLLSIHIEPLWQHMIIDFEFDINKGMKYSSYHRGDDNERTEFLVDEFQQVKNDIWVPKTARRIAPNDNEKIVTNINVLKVKVNKDINPNLYKNFPWDDPKYNTKFNMNLQNGQMRRENRIQFKDHPPSYFNSFFGLSLDEAYQMYLEIE